MPRSQGTSRKGKPGKNERAAGLGKALQRSHGQRHSYQPKANGRSHGTGGMAMQPGVESIGVTPVEENNNTRSVLELQDIDDFLQQADLANREFMSEKEGLVVLDATTQAYRGPPRVQWEDQNPKDSFVFKELSVPRRPEWDSSTTPQELDRKEREAFLHWRRSIAAKEEELMRDNIGVQESGSAAAMFNHSVSVTPFEKNLEVWRQLWRVVERSDCMLQLVDARNPLFYLSDDLLDYAKSLNKPMMVLINKSDYLSDRQRQYWYDYLTSEGWEYPVFFSAVLEQQKLDAAAQQQRKEENAKRKHANDAVITGPSIFNAINGDGGDAENDESSNGAEDDENDGGQAVEDEGKDGVERDGDKEQQKVDLPLMSVDGIGIDVPLSREQLMETMMSFARKHSCEPNPRYDNRIQFGCVGFPNVGKSSVINVLVGSSKHAHGVVRVGVASQPGKTKHFQTLLLPDNDDMMLCDCPGLVFPSFVSNTADLIAAGVYPIAQMRDHWPVINLICQRIPREIINAHYGIHLPVPTEAELRERNLTKVPPPTAEEFLTTFCVARSMLAASSGVPDYPRAARMVIKDYAEGKLLYCHPPPSIASERSQIEPFYKETIRTALYNTKKLREKLLLSKQLEGQQGNDVNVEDDSFDDGDSEASEDDADAAAAAAELDGDLLELLGGSASSAAVAGGTSKNKKAGKQKQKWGKKDRKNRNKDPYGCHSSNPDEMLYKSGALSGGVSVSAGKYSRSGYTRPNYAGVKSANWNA